MSKKPSDNNQESPINRILREYLLEEELMRGKINDPNLEFGYKFVFPGGMDPQGRQRGRDFTVIQPKGKNVIELRSGTMISPEHVKKLGDKKKHFYAALHKYLLSKNFLFQLDAKQNRYALIDVYFLNLGGTISKNTFFKMVRKIFTSTIYSVVLLQEFCEDVLDLGDLELR